MHETPFHILLRSLALSVACNFCGGHCLAYHPAVGRGFMGGARHRFLTHGPWGGERMTPWGGSDPPWSPQENTPHFFDFFLDVARQARQAPKKQGPRRACRATSKKTKNNWGVYFLDVARQARQAPKKQGPRRACRATSKKQQTIGGPVPPPWGTRGPGRGAPGPRRGFSWGARPPMTPWGDNEENTLGV